jgi:pantetheine-phosphate adenylyltransferase
MSIWIYPGSFDPVTVGHVDIAERASRLCDRLIVAVLDNISKKAAFTADERVYMLHRATAHLKNVETARFDGLLAEFAREKGAAAIVRGLRAVSDFEMEFQIAAMNRRLAPEVETVFIMTSTENSFVSSTIAKDVGRHGGDISGLIPEANLEFVKNALLSRRS